MAYGYGAYQQYQQPSAGYQQPQGYPYGGYQQPQQLTQQVQTPGTLFARFVTCREEAVAAQVIPDGNINLFFDSGHGRIYAKKIDPQSGAADFREYISPQPAQRPADQPQYVPMELFAALKSEVEQLKGMQTQPQKRGGKEGNAE